MLKFIHQAFLETSYLANQKSIQLVIGFETDFTLKADPEIIKKTVCQSPYECNKILNHGGLFLPHRNPYSSEVKVIVKMWARGFRRYALPFVFDKFTQEIPRCSGFWSPTGIGLSFCKMAVESQEVKFGLNQEKNKGASFWFTLPVVHK